MRSPRFIRRHNVLSAALLCLMSLLSQHVRASDNDRDNDGVRDNVDQCLDEAEDRDSFQDGDGCPDPDNDGDRVLDTDDACPLVPGGSNNRGCPLLDRDGDTINDASDFCPDVPEDMDDHDDRDGCPEQNDVDNDNDKIPDSLDGCPGTPEDIDSFQDDDGCPDPDNDLDTVLDTIDRCPNEAGTVENQGCLVTNRDRDKVPDHLDQCPDLPGALRSGCPKRVMVEKTATHIITKQPIEFVDNSNTIKGGISGLILDQVALVLRSNPHLNLVIEGHTEDTGPADLNLRLSDTRAKAVRSALIHRGIAPSRLKALGYGESRPLEANATAQGRARNGRIEFKLVTPSQP